MDTPLRILLAVAAAAVGAPALADDAQAAQRCEAAVAETVQRVRGPDARDVRFVGARRAITSASDDEIGVSGEGRYRRADGFAMPFTYSCAFNQKTGGTSGVVFRETAAATAAPRGPWQPDLTNLSPRECESAVAALLKERYPHMGPVTFDPASRRLQPASDARTRLEGRGTMQRAPGMSPADFGYRCDVDARSGKVLSARAGD